MSEGCGIDICVKSVWGGEGRGLGRLRMGGEEGKVLDGDVEGFEGGDDVDLLPVLWICGFVVFDY